MDSPVEKSSQKDFLKELLNLIVIAIVVVIPFRLFIAQPFIVDGLSMFPTYKNGHYLIIDEISYRFKSPERGSVMVFKFPKDPSKFFVKRVIGLPGEKVEINSGVVTIFNAENPDGLTLAEPYVKFPKDDTLSHQLEEGEYFVMGDNRASSADSRIWGAVPEENIIGRPIIRFIPPAILPGDISEFVSAESNYQKD